MMQTGLKTLELKQVIVTKKRMRSERVADQIQRTSKEILQRYPDKKKEIRERLHSTNIKHATPDQIKQKKI
jgi:hypothetical protein